MEDGRRSRAGPATTGLSQRPTAGTCGAPRASGRDNRLPISTCSYCCSRARRYRAANGRAAARRALRPFEESGSAPHRDTGTTDAALRRSPSPPRAVLHPDPAPLTASQSSPPAVRLDSGSRRPRPRAPRSEVPREGGGEAGSGAARAGQLRGGRRAVPRCIETSPSKMLNVWRNS